MNDINVNSIVVDTNVVLEYERLRKIFHIQFGYPSPKFSIALLNIRSIFKHSDDLSCDPILMKSNLICLTETQLFNNDCYNILKTKFKQHQLVLHNNEDKFKSLALLKNQFIESYIEYIDGAIYAEFKKFCTRCIFPFESSSIVQKQQPTNYRFYALFKVSHNYKTSRHNTRRLQY